MIQNFISMNGYGFFVWLSFAITFLACGIVYYKTYKTLKKYEKDFAGLCILAPLRSLSLAAISAND